jgi:hypothetical protein
VENRAGPFSVVSGPDPGIVIGEWLAVLRMFVEQI